jgi:hypothetical protein
MISEFIREDDPVDEFVERRAGQQRYGVVTSLEILVEIRHGPRGPVGWRSVARARRTAASVTGAIRSVPEWLVTNLVTNSPARSRTTPHYPDRRMDGARPNSTKQHSLDTPP